MYICIVQYTYICIYIVQYTYICILCSIRTYVYCAVYVHMYIVQNTYICILCRIRTMSYVLCVWTKKFKNNLLVVFDRCSDICNVIVSIKDNFHNIV